MSRSEGLHLGWMLALGIILIITGILAIAMPMIMALAIELLLGWLFLFAGIFQIVSLIFSKRWGGFLTTLLIGILLTVAGIVMLRYPMHGVFTLTIVLAITFFLQGIFETMLAFQVKPAPGWGWILFSGIIGLIIAVIMFSNLAVGAMMIGLLAGINILFSGISLTIITIAARKLEKELLGTP